MKNTPFYFKLISAVLSISLIILILPIKAQDAAIKPVVHDSKTSQYYHGSVQDLSWLQGTWQGDGLGGNCQEVWEKPFGNTMMGMFKILKDGKPVFYEFFVLVEEGGLIELRLKHFTSTFKSWETKDEFVSFRLIRLEGHKASFDGLTMEKIGNNRLRVQVVIKHQDGSVREELFNFVKQS